jgi:hypothetical protein
MQHQLKTGLAAWAGCDVGRRCPPNHCCCKQTTCSAAAARFSASQNSVATNTYTRCQQRDVVTKPKNECHVTFLVTRNRLRLTESVCVVERGRERERDAADAFRRYGDRWKERERERERERKKERRQLQPHCFNGSSSRTHSRYRAIE